MTDNYCSIDFVRYYSSFAMSVSKVIENSPTPTGMEQSSDSKSSMEPIFQIHKPSPSGRCFLCVFFVVMHGIHQVYFARLHPDWAVCLAICHPLLPHPSSVALNPFIRNEQSTGVIERELYQQHHNECISFLFSCMEQKKYGPYLNVRFFSMYQAPEWHCHPKVETPSQNRSSPSSGVALRPKDRNAGFSPSEGP